MTKIVINACHGGFGLSDEAVERYAELKGITLGPRQKLKFGGAYWYRNGIKDDDHYFSSYSIEGRDDPALIQVVEEMGAAGVDNDELEIMGNHRPGSGHWRRRKILAVWRTVP